MNFYKPGLYRCLVTEQAFQTAKSGIPMVVWKIRPEYLLSERIGTEGKPYVDEERTSKRYERICWFAINEGDDNALDYAIRKLRHAGFTGNSMDALNFPGESIVFECKSDTYQGNPSEKWDLPLPKKASAPLKNDSSLARKMNAIFGRRLAAGARAAPPLMGAAADDGAPPIDDDHIPF